MKKYILLLLLVTGFAQAQTLQNPTYGNTTTNTLKIKTPATSTTALEVGVLESDGAVNKMTPTNLSIPYVPLNYSVLTPSIGGHLSGLDTKIGTIVATTAGISTRVWWTADPTTITAGTFYLSNTASKGSVASAIQNVVNNDNEKKYFAQDLIGVPFATAATFPVGVYAGNLSASTSPNSAQQRLTVEIYKCNNDGTPIASGITGAPVGSLGVTVIAILDSGLLTLVDGSVTNVPVSGNLASPLSVAVGERVRYHVSAEKVGTAGANITQSVYYGTSYNSYLDVPVPLNTTAVQNLSTVAGTTSTDAFNTLNNNLATSDKTNQNVFVGFKRTTAETINNMEFNTSVMDDGTIIRVGIYSTVRLEQAIGAYVAFSKSTDNGVTWSSPVTAYTPSGETCESPVISSVGTRINIVFRTTTDGTLPYTTGTTRTIYSNDGGVNWITGTNPVSPIGEILTPYGRVDVLADGKHVALFYNRNYCEAWDTTDAITWAYRSTVYDYRSAPIGGTSVIIEPNYVYIGSGKCIIVARNNIGSSALQFVSSDNLATSTYSGVTNLNDGILVGTRSYNPVALYADLTNRVLYAFTNNRSIIVDSKEANTILGFTGDLDAIFSSPTAYVLKYNIDLPLPNANIYNKGYHSLVKVPTGLLGLFTQTTLNFRQTSSYATSRINDSYQYNIIFTDKPFDFKNITNIYPNSKQTKNINTGNFDYITEQRVHDLDQVGNIQGRYNNSWIFPNFTADVNIPVAQFAGSRKYFEVFNNRLLGGVPLTIQMSTSITTGEEAINTLTSTDGFSLVFAAIKSSSATTHQLIRASGNKPFSLGTSGNNSAIYINADGAIKLGSAATASAWLDLQASTTAHSSLLIPTGTAPTTPISGGVWRPSAGVLNFYDGTTTQQFAFLNNPTFVTGITTPAINLSGQTASTIAILDAAKNVISANTATYPSLTELSYAKGVTSSIQSQINANLSHWTKTGNDIRNNNSGTIELKPSLKVSVLDGTNTEKAYINNLGTIKGERFLGTDNGSGMENISSQLMFTAYGTSEFRFNPIYLNEVGPATRDIIGFSNSLVNPTSGSAIFNFLNLSPTINQTGGANGITRSLYIDPTLTSAVDYRAIEVVTGKSILQNLQTKLVELGTYTVATLPTPTTATAYATVTDALAPAYMVAVVGGGTVVCPVFYDGISWKSH